MTLVRGRLVLVLVLAGLVVSLLAVRAANTSSGADTFVTRSGNTFTVNGKPFRFVGVNLYDGASSDSYSCRPQSRLSETALRRLLRQTRQQTGATVVRFWAFQTYTAGGTDFAGMNRMISAARSEGMRVIPVLENGPGDCSTGTSGVPKSSVDGDTWYTEGYRRPFGNARISYRDYVRLVAQHYRDEPTIMAWMMMNEAETNARDRLDRTALAPFALDIANVIRSVDPRHLITVGTQSNGAPGSSGPDFAAIYGQSAIDFVEMHDWAYYGSDTEPMPGMVNGKLPAPGSGQCQSRTARIACSFAEARQLNKPILVGEVGITAITAADRSRRAALIAAKMNAAFAAGASGYMLWQVNTLNTDGYAWVPGQHDPLATVLKSRAASLR